jgi:hypothetical protein
MGFLLAKPRAGLYYFAALAHGTPPAYLLQIKFRNERMPTRAGVGESNASYHA